MTQGRGGGRGVGANAWRPTTTFYRSAVLAIGLVGCAVAFGRSDLVVLATPFAIVTAWSTISRPEATPAATNRLGHPTLREGQATTWHAEVAKLESADLVTVMTAAPLWIELRPTGGAVSQVATGESVSLTLSMRATRWGRRQLEPLQVTVHSDWAAFRHTKVLPSEHLTALPMIDPFDSRTPVRSSDGLVGAARSSRAGEGSEFAGARPFQVGDRMRRINWTRSARSESLVMNSTWADRDIHVALVIDSSVDLGASGGCDGKASSLDVTVRAAAAVCEHYIRRGDRVSLANFDFAPKATAPAGTGQAHLRRVLDGLARVALTRGRFPEQLSRALLSAEMVVVFSPLVVRHAIDRAVLLSRFGRTVVVVDTLPDDLVDDDDELTSLAWRVRLLERRRELRRAEEQGVAVVPWRGPGSLDQILRDAARRASAPRVRS